MKDQSLPECVSIGALASLIGVTERQVRNLLTEAGAQPPTRGKWPLAASVRAIMDKARASKQDNELSKARARAIRASARKTELATAKAERELIPIEDAHMAMDAVCGAVREEFDGLPTRLTRDRDQRTLFIAECRGALSRIAAVLEKQSKALNQGELDNE